MIIQSFIVRIFYSLFNSPSPDYRSLLTFVGLEGKVVVIYDFHVFRRIVASTWL